MTKWEQDQVTVVTARAMDESNDGTTGGKETCLCTWFNSLHHHLHHHLHHNLSFN